MLERVSALVKGGVMHKPLWFDAMLAHPPPVKVKGPKPIRLQWDDDRLRNIYLRRNPAATLQPKALFLDPTRPEASHEHEADTFIKKQKSYMRKGASEEEAYRLVLKELKAAAEEQERIRQSEVENAREQAAALGATPSIGGKPKVTPTMAEQLLRLFAEEARDAGQAFPKHWFGDGGKGAWLGISGSLSQDMLAKTQNVLDHGEADVGAIAAMLRGEQEIQDGATGLGKGGRQS